MSLFKALKGWKLMQSCGEDKQLFVDTGSEVIPLGESTGGSANQLIITFTWNENDGDVITANMTFEEATTLLNKGSLTSFLFLDIQNGKVQQVSTQIFIETYDEDSWIICIQTGSNAVVSKYKWEASDGNRLSAYTSEK